MTCSCQKRWQPSLLARFFLSLKKTYTLKKSTRFLLHFKKKSIRMNHRYSKSFILNEEIKHVYSIKRRRLNRCLKVLTVVVTGMPL